MERLKRRTDFRAVSQAADRGVRAPAKAFVVQARLRRQNGSQDSSQDGSPDGNRPARIGFTVSRQVGNAVERNRVRRRLRELVRLSPGAVFCAGHDYVVIGRRSALAAPFADMLRDLDAALRRVNAAAAAAPATGGRSAQAIDKAGSPGRQGAKPQAWSGTRGSSSRNRQSQGTSPKC